MPSRPGDVPSPLAGLPRPLDERHRPSRLRRLLTLGVVVVILGGIGYLGYQLWAFGSASAASGGPGAATASASDAAVAAAPGASAVAPVVDPGTLGTAAQVAPPTPTPTPTATPAPTPAPVSSLTGYQWPLRHGRVTLPFGPTGWGSRIVDGEKFHDGIDLATFCGDHVVAAHDGVVLAASRHYDHLMGWVGDLQPYLDRLEKKKAYSTLPIVVVIDDLNGYRSIYAHFSKVVVKKGQAVQAGDFLGYEGMTGHATGCHVHYGLFSPLETATFGIDPDVIKRMRTPSLEIARVDPLKVLPPRPEPTKKPKPTKTP